MDIKKLQSIVVDALEDVKGQDIQLFDTVHLTSLFDRVLVVSGTSNRQTRALAASVRDKVKGAGGDIVSMEGETTGEWVLVDLGDMVVHIMQPAIRAYYRLEEIWGDKPVKLGAAKRTAKKTASPSTDDEEKPKRTRKTAAKAPVEVTFDMMAIQAPLEDDEKPARKPRARKTATTETAAEKPAARKPRAPAVPSGGRVKVAATKSSVASAKQAAAKRTTRKKAAE